jgi:intracellular multiplication protein IcmV
MKANVNVKKKGVFRKIIKGSGKALKPFVNFPSWMGWKQISQTGQGIKGLATSIFSRPESKRVETFEEAIARLGLDEETIQRRSRGFLKSALIYLLFALGIFAYTVFLMITTSYILAILFSLVLSLFILTLAFRQHFWYFQMKVRRLGCSFEDWVKFTLRGVRQ